MITGGVAAAAVRLVLSSNNFEAGDAAASSFKNLDCAGLCGLTGLTLTVPLAISMPLRADSFSGVEKDLMGEVCIWGFLPLEDRCSKAVFSKKLSVSRLISAESSAALARPRPMEAEKDSDVCHGLVMFFTLSSLICSVSFSREAFWPSRMR